MKCYEEMVTLHWETADILFLFLDTSSLEFCLQTELHFCMEQPQKEEVAPLPPISSVLLAFSILGELPTKLRSFGK